MRYTVYILECDNGSYYTGITTHLARRYQEHQQGIRCRYTRAFPPKRIVAAWELTMGGKSLAQKIEALIKKQSKLNKTRLILQPHILQDLLQENRIETGNYVII